MSTTKSAEERTVESADDQSASLTDDDHRVPPHILAESIRNETSALADQGEELADKLERLADEDGEDEIDPAAMMTELLETASDLVAVAHQIEDARVQE